MAEAGRRGGVHCFCLELFLVGGKGAGRGGEVVGATRGGAGAQHFRSVDAPRVGCAWGAAAGRRSCDMAARVAVCVRFALGNPAATLSFSSFERLNFAASFRLKFDPRGGIYLDQTCPIKSHSTDEVFGKRTMKR